jgi:hypothetical protein
MCCILGILLFFPSRMTADREGWEVVVRWEGEDWRVGVWRDTTVGQLKVLLEALHEPRLLRPNAQRLVLVDDGPTTTPHAELEDHAPLRQYGLLLEPTAAATTTVPFLRAAAEEDRSTPFVRLSVRDDAPDYPLFPMPWLCELTEPRTPVLLINSDQSHDTTAHTAHCTRRTHTTRPRSSIALTCDAHYTMVHMQCCPRAEHGLRTSSSSCCSSNTRRGLGPTSSPPAHPASPCVRSTPPPTGALPSSSSPYRAAFTRVRVRSCVCGVCGGAFV